MNCIGIAVPSPLGRGQVLIGYTMQRLRPGGPAAWTKMSNLNQMCVQYCTDTGITHDI